MSDPTLKEINAKLDKLLKYQRRQQLFQWISWGIWIATFLFLVVIPLYYAYDVLKNPADYIDFDQINVFKQQIDQLKSLLSQ